MAAVGRGSVPFAVQQPGAFAVQLRLTPALLEALLGDDGHAASITFGANQQGAITVGDAAFPFRALPEESCDLLRLPAGAAASAQPAALLGAVRHKLMVQRNIADERDRVRARAEEAERRGHERGAKLLAGGRGGTVKAAGRAGRTTTTVQRATPPPQLAPPQQGQQQRQGQQQLTAAMLAAPQPAAPRPPPHPATQPRARSVTPPPDLGAAAAAAAPKGMHKSASTSRLPNGGAGGGSQTASALVLQAARSGAGLRLVLIAMLSEKQMGPAALKTVIADVAARVRAFKVPSKEELNRQLKAVSEFRSPGIYVVWPQLLRELEALPPGGAAAAGARGGSGSPPDGSGGSGEAAPRKRLKKAGGAAAAVAAGAGAPVDGAAAPPAVAAAAAAAGGKRARFEGWSDDESDDLPAAPPRARERAHAQASAPAALAGGGGGASDSPPSVGPAGGGGPRGSLRRTSSSRGSDGADESWIEEHADRQPEPAAPIASREEYAAREAAFNAKYDVYFSLHQLIEAHKKDVEALAAAQAAAPGAAERERLRAELERLLQRRGERAKRWDQAYRVLHQELSAAKQCMSEFVRQVQQQQQQPAGGGAGAPAVRVK